MTNKKNIINFQYFIQSTNIQEVQLTGKVSWSYNQ